MGSSQAAHSGRARGLVVQAGCREPFRVPVEEGTVADQDRTGALLRKSREGRFEIVIGSDIHNKELETQRRRRHLQGGDHGWGSWKRRVRKNAEQSSIGYQLVEQLQTFWCQFGG
jgi:hypothetical protein